MKSLHLLWSAGALGLLLSVACSDDDTGSNGPGQQAGSAGQAQAGTGGGSAGTGGSSGGGAGGKAGGGQGAEAGAGGAGDGGSAGQPSDTYQAVLGEVCPVPSVIGVVRLGGFPTPSLDATLRDRPSPWLAEPELETPTCAYHRYVPGNCAACDEDEVCSLASQCVPAPRTVKDAVLVVTTGSEQQVFEANAELGNLYGQLQIGDASAEYAMTLTWAGFTLELPAMPVASGQLTDAAVEVEGKGDLTPGALTATWSPAATGAFVRSTIPINHHAGGPTFTECVAPESAGSFHAEAEMIDPLSVITGLEFQGLEHVFVAAAQTPAGCVEFRFGEHVGVWPQ